MKLPEMQEVTSSNIFALGYDTENQTAFVQFLENDAGGAIYMYKDVPELEFNTLMTAPSIGAYLNKSYKGVYTYEKCENIRSVAV